jgi:hypothetical protein
VRKVIVPSYLKKKVITVISHSEASVIRFYLGLKHFVFPSSHTSQFNETEAVALFELYLDLRTANLVTVTIESVDTMKRWHRLWANQANPPEMGVVGGIFDGIAKDVLWDVRRQNIIVGETRDLLDSWMVFV